MSSRATLAEPSVRRAARMASGSEPNRWRALKRSASNPGPTSRPPCGSRCRLCRVFPDNAHSEKRSTPRSKAVRYPEARWAEAGGNAGWRPMGAAADCSRNRCTVCVKAPLNSWPRPFIAGAAEKAAVGAAAAGRQRHGQGAGAGVPVAEDAGRGRACDARGPGPGKGVHATYVSRVLRLTLLAPEIVEAILDGRQPAELQLDDLLRDFRWSGRGNVLRWPDSARSRS